MILGFWSFWLFWLVFIILENNGKIMVKKMVKKTCFSFSIDSGSKIIYTFFKKVVFRVPDLQNHGFRPLFDPYFDPFLVHFWTPVVQYYVFMRETWNICSTVLLDLDMGISGHEKRGQKGSKKGSKRVQIQLLETAKRAGFWTPFWTENQFFRDMYRF